MAAATGARTKWEGAGEFHCSDFDWEEHARECRAKIESGVAAAAAAAAAAATATEVAATHTAAESWESFYAKMTTKFFKPKRYIAKCFAAGIAEARRVSAAAPLFVLEAGCGNGACAIALAHSSPLAEAFFLAVDFSEKAVELVREEAKKESLQGRVGAAVCDLTKVGKGGLLAALNPGKGGNVDLAFLVFVLSAIRPEEQAQAVANLVSCLCPGGVLCFRDYGEYDMAHMRFEAKAKGKGKAEGEGKWRRGDGTLSHFFTLAETRALFESCGLGESWLASSPPSRASFSLFCSP